MGWLTEYLEFRQRSGEILTPKSHLFIHDFDPRNSKQVKKPKALSYQAIKSKIRHLLLRANIITEQKISATNQVGRRRNEIKMSHGFRKFAITEMGRSRMDPEVREYLRGHSLGVRELYLKYGESDRLNEYLRAVDNLTINAENRLLAQVDEYKKQEQEITDLKKELAAYQDQTKDIQDQLRSVGDAREYVRSVAKDASKLFDSTKDKKELERLLKRTGKEVCKQVK